MKVNILQYATLQYVKSINQIATTKLAVTFCISQNKAANLIEWLMHLSYQNTYILRKDCITLSATTFLVPNKTLLFLHKYKKPFLFKLRYNIGLLFRKIIKKISISFGLLRIELGNIIRIISLKKLKKYRELKRLMKTLSNTPNYNYAINLLLDVFDFEYDLQHIGSNLLLGDVLYKGTRISVSGKGCAIELVADIPALNGYESLCVSHKDEAIYLIRRPEEQLWAL